MGKYSARYHSELRKNGPRPPKEPPITNGAMCGVYDGAELVAPIRSGADDALAYPSRIGNYLHYRDGRITHVEERA